MKTYLQINESKIILKASKSHSLCHCIHSFNSVHANYYTAQKAFPEGCATKSVRNTSDMAVGRTVALTCIMSANAPAEVHLM